VSGRYQSDKDYLLNKSKHFCMLPWVHVHLWPDNQAFPCCISNSDFPMGKYEGSLKAVWNSAEMKQLRKAMVNDEPSEACKRCYELESSGVLTLRKTSIEQFGKNFDAVTATHADGGLDKLDLRYLDFRFSNLCNFKCRTCGPDLSSSWVDDHKALFGGNWQRVLRIDPRQHMWEELRPMLNQVEVAYFAGGEPCITDELYQILDHWISINHTNVAIGYTTNFSVLKFNGKSVLDYWNAFPNTRISASLDDSGARAEYMRKGTVWSQIENNRRRMLQECPNVYFEITPTISIFNVWHFPEFHRQWVHEGLVDVENIRLNLLTNPVHQRLDNLPRAMRDQLAERWLAAKDDLLSFCYEHERDPTNMRTGYDAVITMLSHESQVEKYEDFWQTAFRLDRLRGEDLLKVFPEFTEFALQTGAKNPRPLSHAETPVSPIVSLLS